MKRRCKKVDIFSIRLIIQAIMECLKPAKKRRRRDTCRMFSRALRISLKRAYKCLMAKDELYLRGVQNIAQNLRDRLVHGQLSLPPIKQEYRYDGSSRKTRLITILHIEHLIFDHLAVLGLAELFKRVGEFQVSAIKGRGVHYGCKAIRKWVNKKSCKYAVKLDIKNFYGSIDKKILMRWLEKRVKNQPLLWLVDRLFSVTPDGIPIGSFLSQTIANIYLSDLYHFAKERAVHIRHSRRTGEDKRVAFVKHALFYMDDMLLLGSNKRHLKRAVMLLVQKAAGMGLRVKPNWHVYRIDMNRPVDIMGFRFSYNVCTIRKRIFVRVRRVIIRNKRRIRKNKKLPRQSCTRLGSYFGYIIHSDNNGLYAKYRLSRITATVFKANRLYDHQHRITTALHVGAG